MIEQRFPIDEQDDIYNQFYNLTSVASTNELTGLTPALPVSEEEVIAYEQLYSMPVPEGIDNNSKKEKKTKGK